MATQHVPLNPPRAIDQLVAPELFAAERGERQIRQRNGRRGGHGQLRLGAERTCRRSDRKNSQCQTGVTHRKSRMAAGIAAAAPRSIIRSEEHTSELQSQSNLVCRLLLEKKKKKKRTIK